MYFGNHAFKKWFFYISFVIESPSFSQNERNNYYIFFLFRQWTNCIFTRNIGVSSEYTSYMSLGYRGIIFYPLFNRILYYKAMLNLAHSCETAVSHTFISENLCSVLNAGNILYALNILRNTAFAQSIRKVK